MQFQSVKDASDGRFMRNLVFTLSLLLSTIPAFDAFALSSLNEIPTVEDPEEAEPEKEPPPVLPGLPLPDPLVNSDAASKAKALNDGKPVVVLYDINAVPEPVRHMRQMLVEAAASGDMERLRPLLGTGAATTDVEVGDTAGDPINTLKELAGDPDGIEILSSMLNILATGFVHVSPGTPDEAYVWPYFAAKPLSALTPPEKVEMMRIVTSGDYADMVEFGTYSYYRIGISPDGKWKFFRSGE